MSRSHLLGASLAAVLPMAAAASPAPAAVAEPFVAPTAPLLLTRTLRRPLPDGAEIVSVRRYEIVVVADGEGFRVDGRLLGAEVTAPAHLGALAEIERARPDTGLFPFRLDASGLIASSARPGDGAAADQARPAAEVVIARSALTPPDREQAEALIGQIVAGSPAPGAQWPRDLFVPAPGLRSQTSRVALVGGQDGTVTTTVDARRDGVEAVIERTVITETGGNQRVTRETYAVRPAKS